MDCSLNIFFLLGVASPLCLFLDLEKGEGLGEWKGKWHLDLQAYVVQLALEHHTVGAWSTLNFLVSGKGHCPRDYRSYCLYCGIFDHSWYRKKFAHLCGVVGTRLASDTGLPRKVNGPLDWYSL